MLSHLLTCLSLLHLLVKCSTCKVNVNLPFYVKEIVSNSPSGQIRLFCVCISVSFGCEAFSILEKLHDNLPRNLGSVTLWIKN